MTVEEATSEADSVLLPKLRKTLTLVFTNYIIGMIEKRNTALMKAIFKKTREYAEDGFGERAAIKAAVSYRKHMNYLVETHNYVLMHIHVWVGKWGTHVWWYETRVNFVFLSYEKYMIFSFLICLIILVNCTRVFQHRIHTHQILF